MKQCNTCLELKPLSDFHKHLDKKDGHTGKCKECANKRRRELFCEQMKNKEWVEKERERGREKYHRLDYKTLRGERYDKAKERKYKIDTRNRFPEMYEAQRSVRFLPKAEKGMEKHHWNYDKPYHKDVIIMPMPEHRKIHRFLKYDQFHYVFRDLEGNLLDTKEKHEAYIQKVLQLPN